MGGSSNGAEQYARYKNSQKSPQKIVNSYKKKAQQTGYTIKNSGGSGGWGGYGGSNYGPPLRNRVPTWTSKPVARTAARPTSGSVCRPDNGALEHARTPAKRIPAQRELMRLLTRREHRFPAMGTRCHVVVVGGDSQLPAGAEARIRELQGRWTRFEPDSEISRLNALGSATLSPDSWRLLAAGVVGRALTDGRFDPFLERQIVAAGYDRDFAELTDTQPTGTARAAVARPIQSWDRRRRWSDWRPGRARLGRVGKGLAADLVSAELMAAGAVACLVNLGATCGYGATKERRGRSGSTASPTASRCRCGSPPADWRPAASADGAGDCRRRARAPSA